MYFPETVAATKKPGLSDDLRLTLFRLLKSRWRPRLDVCLEYVREGDSLIVARLDWLARSTLHLCQTAAELVRDQVNRQVVGQDIDISDTTGLLLFNILGVVAKFETDIRAERNK